MSLGALLMTLPPKRIDFDSLPWQDALPGARFKVLREGTKQFRLLELSSAFLEPQWCEKGHAGFVLDGTLEVDFKGRVVVYPQGSGISIPPGAAAAHKARSLTPTVRLFLVEDV